MIAACLIISVRCSAVSGHFELFRCIVLETFLQSLWQPLKPDRNTASSMSLDQCIISRGQHWGTRFVLVSAVCKTHWLDASYTIRRVNEGRWKGSHWRIFILAADIRLRGMSTMIARAIGQFSGWVSEPISLIDCFSFAKWQHCIKFFLLSSDSGHRFASFLCHSAEFQLEHTFQHGHSMHDMVLIFWKMLRIHLNS
jgi:hypothetical protein